MNNYTRTTGKIGQNLDHYLKSNEGLLKVWMRGES